MAATDIRIIIRKFLEAGQLAADLTETEIDDNAVEMVLKALDSDVLWFWLSGWITKWLSDDEQLLTGSDAPAVAAELGINPLTVLAIIKAAIELWKQMRK